jgi:hypothetical protein
MGCGANEGACAESERACTDDLAGYCGCDGNTYYGSGSCPGLRYEHVGECAGDGEPGDPCDTDSDCESGVCEGMGCDAGEGVCANAERACTLDDQPYCGCDGETFYGSGSCPGERYEHVGECEGDGAPGSSCDTDADCESGICEGEGCSADQGVCAEADRACDLDLATFCGCDGETFYGGGNCPGGRYEYAGTCEGDGAPGTSCDSNAACDSGICEGEGCSADEGVCAEANRGCTDDEVDYCGCDGETFSSSGSCPGARYEHVGACEG